MPAARNLTDAKGVRAFIYDVPRHNPDLIYVGLNDRDAAWHDLYKVKISTGERKLLRKNTDQIAGWVFDHAGKLRLATRTADNGDTEILRVTDAGFEQVYRCTVFETLRPASVPYGQRACLHGDEPREPDLTRLVLFDPETKQEELVESDPAEPGGLRRRMFSEKTDELVGTIYVDERHADLFPGQGFEADYKLIKSKLPGQRDRRSPAPPPTTVSG